MIKHRTSKISTLFFEAQAHGLPTQLIGITAPKRTKSEKKIPVVSVNVIITLPN